jgi:hypothetical protein
VSVDRKAFLAVTIEVRSDLECIPWLAGLILYGLYAWTNIMFVGR